MNSFEELLLLHKTQIERYVRFRVPEHCADDVIQEVYLTAFQKFHELRDPECFKPWMLTIARNKCNDHFRRLAKNNDISFDELDGTAAWSAPLGCNEKSSVRDTLLFLGDRDKEILYLVYWMDMPQAEIATRLGIPLGTVKSRLSTAKKHFKEHYLHAPITQKGEEHMKKLPKILPEYSIVRSEKEPFSVVWEELMGWFFVPKLGEKLSWGMYDMPERVLTESDYMETVGKAIVHGIEGVRIRVKTNDPMDCNSEGGQSKVERGFVAQLTDTHCRYLAESHVRDGVDHYYTFLDGDAFTDNWGFGENNCGNEIHLSPKGMIKREGDRITSPEKPFLIDIVGRYDVTIFGRTHDTVCVLDIETYNEGVLGEQFLDKDGRTVLWRRFNADDWGIDRYGKPWSELLPNNERLFVNGKTYVHWYDCITDRMI